jgi:hypothetical protein
LLSAVPIDGDGQVLHEGDRVYSYGHDDKWKPQKLYGTLHENEMKVLHITPSTNGYEEVTLLANRISKTNGFSAIEKNGEQFMTGGFLIKDTPQIRAVLDAIPKEQQYQFVTDFKIEPFVKCYLEDGQ